MSTKLKVMQNNCNRVHLVDHSVPARKIYLQAVRSAQRIKIRDEKVEAQRKLRAISR
jgi:hypothetical protein